MTSKERILRSIAGKEVDRLPCSPRLWKFVMGYYGVYNTETMLKSTDEFDWDLHHSTSYGVRSFFTPGIPDPASLPKGVRCEGEVVQGEDYDTIRRTFTTPAGKLSDLWHRPHPNRGYGISPTPTPVETLLKEPGDLEALRFLRGEVMPQAIRNFTETRDRIGDRGYHYPYVRSPFNDLSYLLPVDTSLTMPYDDPALFAELLAFLQTMCLDDIRAHLAAGADGVFLSGFHISLSVGWSPKIFREFFLPLIKEQGGVIRGGGAFFHYYDDGKTMAILPMMLEAGVDVFETCTPWPAGDFDPRAARAIAGDRMTFMGYVDIENVLHRGTPRLVEETVRDSCEAMGRGGRYIIGSSDGVLAQTPLENMRTYFGAGRRYGREAIG
jgi:uroporphyrinogen-III decarboxylase